MNMPVSTTYKQNELLAFIQNFQIVNDGVSPSFDEMADAVGLKSKSGVHRLLSALEERGQIARLRARPRAIQIIPDNIFTGIPSSQLVAELARRGEPA